MVKNSKKSSWSVEKIPKICDFCGKNKADNLLIAKGLFWSEWHFLCDKCRRVWIAGYIDLAQVGFGVGEQ